ncbi:hypothetical protein [Burkholderia sp. Ac-20365]|uniref:hypothetical protein n=1 Tax=Burkholderia sp. Ac-20365 TaxID=2703897 RepID=UPI00197B5F42|nr:hypothetical protein [Burkholderia sp. Ac-20365]MBN3761184.1 hypothetical protein [Burkholderia sp. Ac-20365]
MKTLALFVALAGVPVWAEAAAPSPDALLIAPSSFQPDGTYMVVRSGDTTVIAYYSDPNDCDRFKIQLKGECIGGAEAMKRYPDRKR